MQTAECSVRRVVADIGITYRQLDYARRTGILPPASGSGTRYFLDADAIARLTVAAALSRSAGGSWPRMARAVMAGPPPPSAGWACLRPDGSILYSSSLDDVAPRMIGGYMIVAYFGERSA